VSRLRKIIHCDCDCFFAAVEVRDQPALRGQPVAVGGSSSRRGVVATCNYEARRFGVRSAMSMAQALRRCPGLVVIPTNMAKYRDISAQISEIYADYTTLVEPLSLDEAYLDVSDSPRCNGSATLMAAEIRQRVRDTVGITVSAGVAPNKFLAKVASDWNKPDGQFVILPGQVDGFVRNLPVERLSGVGKVTAARLHAMGLRECGAMQQLSEAQLEQAFGRFGRRLHQLCRGIDEREVRPQRIRKSLSVETTYASDLPCLDACQQQLPALADELQQRWRALAARYVIRGAFVKLRFDDFRTTTVERSLAETVELDLQALKDVHFPNLLADGWARGTRPVRLIGLGLRLLPRAEALNGMGSAQAQQLSLFDT